MGSVSTSIRGVRFTLYIPDGNEWVRFPRHSVSGSILLGLTWDSWCGKGTAPGCAWCLRGAMLLRGFRLFGMALHREPKGTKRSMRYSTFSQWLSRVWLAFMDESQQYGNYHEIAALAAIQQPALIVFVGDHRQTPGGLSKGRAAAANRQKLLQRPLGLRALNRPGDYLPPARLASLVGQLWPDASQDSDSDIARLLRLGKAPHSGVWTSEPTQELPLSLLRLLDQRTLNQINVGSRLIAAILAVLLIATAPEEFGVPECTSTMEAAGLEGPHRWGIILPNSSRVSLLTYKAIVAVRYPELVLQDPIQIGHFVAHDHTVEYGGFRTVFGKHRRISVQQSKM